MSSIPPRAGRACSRLLVSAAVGLWPAAAAGRLPVHDLAAPRPRRRPLDGRQLRRRARREVPQRRRPASSPASASTRAPATPARTSGTCGPAPAPCWPRRPSPARPPPAGSRRPSRAGRGHRQHHLRRLVLRRRRPLLRPTTATSPPRRRRGAAARAAPTAPTAATASTVYGAGGFPTNTFSPPTTGSTSSSTPTAADTTAPTVIARTPGAGATGVRRRQPVTATFSEPVSPRTRHDDR